MKVYFATDHAGFALKNELVPFVRELGFDVEDCGALAMSEADDYPQLISMAAHKLSKDAASSIEGRAIILGGSGQGEAIVANRYPGVRAVVYYGQPKKQHTDEGGRALDIVALTREHNDANALSIGARFVAVEEAKEVVRIWLTTPFSGDERHVRRIREIDSIAHG